MAQTSSSVSPDAPQHTIIALTTDQANTPSASVSVGSSTSPIQFNPFPPAGIEKALEREYLVNSTGWSVADNRGFLDDCPFPEEFTSFSALWNRIAEFKYFAADVHIRVELVAPPTSSGAVVVAPIPFFYGVGGTWPPESPLAAEQLVQVKGAGILSASRGTSYRTVIKWSSDQPFYPVTDVGSNMGLIGTLYYAVMHPLQQPGVASPTPVIINTFASLRNVRVAGYLPTGAAASLPRPRKFKAQSMSSEGASRSAKGVISSLSKATGFPDFSGIVPPSLSPADAVSGVESLVSAVISSLDLPSSQQATTPYRTADTDTVHAHGLYPYSTYSYKPGINAPDLSSLIGAFEVNPTFTEIAMKPGVAQYFTFDTADTADSLLASLWVSPHVYPTYTSGTEVYGVPTPLAIAAAGFRYWRGTIRYKVQFFAPAMTAARVRIVYSPSLNPLPAGIESYAGDMISKVVEIAGDTEASFEIPFLFDLPYAVSAIDQAAAGLGAPPPNDDSSAVGTLGFYLLSPPSSYNSETVSVYATVYAAAGGDFQLMYPIENTVSCVLEVPAPPLPKKVTPGFKAQCSIDLGGSFSQKFPPMAEAQKLVDNRIFDIDPVNSLAEYRRRFRTEMTGITTATELTGIVGFATPGFTGTYTPWSNVLAGCFRGYRGSVRALLKTSTGTSSFSQIRTVPANTAFSFLQSGPADIGTEIPYHTTQMYSPLYRSIPNATTGPWDFYQVTPAAASNLLTALGDDAQFFDFTHTKIWRVL